MQKRQTVGAPTVSSTGCTHQSSHANQRIANLRNLACTTSLNIHRTLWLIGGVGFRVRVANILRKEGRPGDTDQT